MPTVLLATGGYDNFVRFWEAPSGQCYRSIPFAESQINRLEILPNKKAIAVAGNPVVKFFDINTSNPQPVLVLDGHRGNVNSMGFRSDGVLMYTASEDKTVRIWDLRANQCQKLIELPSGVNTAVLHPNEGELVTGEASGAITIWDLRMFKQKRRPWVPAPDQAIRSVAMSSDCTYLTAALHRQDVFVWDLTEQGPRPRQVIKAHPNAHILKCLVSPDSRTLATLGSDHTVKLWTCDEGSEWHLEQTLQGHQRWVWDAVFSCDSAYLVTASSDTSARLWELASGEVVRTYNGHGRAVVAVALNDSQID